MKIKQLEVYLQRNRDGRYSAHVRNHGADGYHFGVNMFIGTPYSPQDVKAAKDAVARTLKRRCLEVETIIYV
jgi:hypothetical protein